MKKKNFYVLIGLICLLPGCQKLVFVRDSGGAEKIYQMEGSGNSQQNISPNNTTVYKYPSISPDGSEIVYTDGQKIFISNVGDIGGSSQRELSTNNNRKALLKWAPDKEVIAYTEFTASQGSIWLAATNGANALQITYPTGNQSDVGQDFYLSNNIKQLIYSRDGNLFTMYFNGTQPASQILNPQSPGSATLPTVSHNGQLLAYKFSFQLTNSGSHNTIQIVDVGTWEHRYGIVLADPVEQGSISSIAFSCDDKRLFVGAETASGSGDRHEVFSVKLDGSNLRQLTNNDYYDSQPSALLTPCR